MIISILHIIKLFIESIFFYLIYNSKNKDLDFKNYNIKKTWLFCLIYTTVIGLCSWFVGFHVIYKVFLVNFIFIYFWTENKKAKDWSFILTFSIFSVLFIEFGYLISYKAICYFDKFLILFNINLVKPITTSMLVLLYSVVLAGVYKLNFIKMQDIKNLSMYKQIPILFGICLLTILYIKYQIQDVHKSSEFIGIMWVILLSLLPTYLGFYIVMCKIARLKNIDQNEILDSIIDKVIVIPMYCAAINFQPFMGVYLKDRLAFKKKLSKLGINHGFKGYSQMVLSLIIIKYFEGESLDFEKNVLRHVARFTKMEPTIIYESFRNIIKKTWFQEESEVLERGYKPGYGVAKRPPKVEEFLIHMAKSA